jgi:hypothetical protein
MGRSQKLSALQGQIFSENVNLKSALKDLATRQKVADKLVAKAHAEGRTTYKRDSAMRLLQRYVTVKGGKQSRNLYKSPQGKEIAAMTVESAKADDVKFTPGRIQVTAEFTFGTDDDRGVRDVVLPVTADTMRKLATSGNLSDAAQLAASAHFGANGVTLGDVEDAFLL